MGLFDGVELDDLVLRGARVSLRPWQDSDSPRVHAIMQDRRMHEFLMVPDPYTHDAARSFVTQLGDEGRREGTGIGCAVVETDTGRVVGSAAVRLSGGQDVGYWIAPDAQGNGYAAEATRLLAEWALVHGLRRVQLYCDVRNVASAAVALRAGFRYEGAMRDRMMRPLDERAEPRVSDLALFSRVAADDGAPVSPAFTPLPRDGLSDAVITLRVIRPQDAQALAETDDALSVGWGFTGQAHSPDEVRRNSDRGGLDWLVGAGAPFSMVDVATGEVAGSIRLRLAGPPGVGGIGYVVHPHFRGRRYTTRALRLLSAWAFEHGGYARLELGAKIGNVASQRAALAAGFEPDGVRAARLRNPDGSFSDEARFALVNPAVVRR